MMPRGQTGRLYRAARRDANGDPIDDDGKVVRVEDAGYVGEVYGLLMGGPSASPSLGRQTTSDTTGMVGVPNHKRNPVVKFDDTLVVDGVRYKIISRATWNYSQSMSTTRPAYSWFRVNATIDG
jgi:hypothetical protein